jgi:carbon storage regulator CsrA
MLVLSRRRGEVVYIGPQILLRVDRLSKHRVKLTIDAPADVTIRRGELARFTALEQEARTTSERASLESM